MERNDFINFGKRVSLLVVMTACSLLMPLTLTAQHADLESAEPFKVGTFEIEEEARVGIVLRDSLIVDLNRANTALEKNATYPKLPPPGRHAGAHRTL